MKLRLFQTLVMSVTLLSLGACGDFLKEYSQNKAYVENVTDLNELLIGEGYFEGGVTTTRYLDDTTSNKAWGNLAMTLPNYFPYIHLMDDDAQEYTAGIADETDNYIRMHAANLHHWQPDPFRNPQNAEITDNNWTETWERIAAMNSIIFQLGEISIGEDEQEMARKVEGEARFLRAQFYFWLANVYGQPYRKESATTDLCIPLKTTEEVEDRYFSRATAEEVYGLMVEDLTRAAECLRGISQTTKYRTNQAAAFLLLSRVHLYMENYEAAITAADSVLAKKDYALNDLNAHEKGTNAVDINSTETIFTHGLYMMHTLLPNAVRAYVSGQGYVNKCTGYTCSDDLMNSYDQTDLRLNVFFKERTLAGTNGYCCWKMLDCEREVSDKFAIRLPEAYLNKAEALACLHRDAEAIATLDELRALRFSPNDFKATDKSGDDLINFIRDERRRELCFEGHRWFDLRRYAVNSVCPFEKEIRHISYLNTNGTVSTEGVYVLQPYSQDKAAYVLPIPQDAIDFNKGNLSNEVRPERPIQPIN